MELDRALELAVVASWDELVVPGEACSVHVEYVDLSKLPVSSLEVWKIKNRGYGTLVCRYSAADSNSSTSHLGIPAMQFTDSYHSQTLADNLDFILRDQHQWSRPSGRSVHGLVQVDLPIEKDLESARMWSRDVHTNSIDRKRGEDLGADPSPRTLGSVAM
jgi:hypothetical protein